MSDHAKTIVLFGATGFIGRQLQSNLLDAGYRVRAVVRPGSKNAENLRPEVEVRWASLQDYDGVRAAVADGDAVIYGAGMVRGAQFEDFLPANVAGLALLADVLQSQAQTPLLLLSSLAAARPEISSYAASKAAGEDVIRQRPQLHWTILRPPAVYGPHDKELTPLFRVARAGILPRVADGDQRLSFIHVEDLAAAIGAWLDHEQALRHGTFSIDDGHIDGYNWHQIAGSVMESRERGWARHAFVLPLPHWLLKAAARANLWLANTNRTAPMLTPGKVRELRAPFWLADNTEFTRITGWQPKLGLAQGIRKTLDSVPEETAAVVLT
ncbi:MAG: NAD-dependent epimerase/dehydratase family protein [Pseudomonadales bacterium]